MAGMTHRQQEQRTWGHVGDQPGGGEARHTGPHDARARHSRLRRGGGVPAQGLHDRGEGAGVGRVERSGRG